MARSQRTFRQFLAYSKRREPSLAEWSMPLARTIRHRGWLWLGLAAALSIALRLPFLFLPMISDEGGYAYVGRRWLNGTGQLYHDIWVSRPQGILVVYGLVDRLFGSSVVSFRLAAWLACVGTMIAVWRYVREWAGRGTAIVSVLVFALIASAPSLEGFTANAEVFMALPAAMAAKLLLDQPSRGWRPRSLLVIGGLCGVATLLKPSGIVMVAVALAFILLEGRGRLGLAARRSGFVFAGFSAAMAPALIDGWHVGWHAFVFAAITYHLSSQSSLSSSPLHHLEHLASLLWHSWWLLMAVAVPLIGRRRAVHERMLDGLLPSIRSLAHDFLRPGSLATRMRTGGVDPGGTLLRLWLLGCLAGIALGGDWWSHYVLQIAAPAAIGLAVLARDALAAMTQVRRLSIATLIAALLLVPYSVVGLTTRADRSEEIFHNTTYASETEIANYLAAHSGPDDRIFVAFNNAAIYYLSDRAGAFPYLFNQELLGMPAAEGHLIAMVSGPHRPEIVIGTEMPSPFADSGHAFWTAVWTHYRVEAVVGNATIYRASVATPHIVAITPDL